MLTWKKSITMHALAKKCNVVVVTWKWWLFWTKIMYPDWGTVSFNNLPSVWPSRTSQSNWFTNIQGEEQLRRIKIREINFIMRTSQKVSSELHHLSVFRGTKHSLKIFWSPTSLVVLNLIISSRNLSIAQYLSHFLNITLELGASNKGTFTVHGS